MKLTLISYKRSFNGKYSIIFKKLNEIVAKKTSLVKKQFNSKDIHYDLINNCFNSHLSITRGDTYIKLKNMTMSELLEETTLKHPTHTAIISAHQNTKYSYEELFHFVNILSRCFIGLGINIQDKIGVYAPNCNEWLFSQFASSKIGAVFVNINPSYQAKDLEFTLNKTEINTLIMPKKLKKSNYIEILNQIDEGFSQKQNKYNLSLKKLPHLKRVILLNDKSADEIEDSNHKSIASNNNIILYEDLLSEFDNPKYDVEINNRQSKIFPNDPANIQFTSGTTGLPKGALLSHFNIINNGYFTGKHLNYDFNDKALIQVPLYHCFGAVMGNIACVSNYSTMIYPSSSFNTEKSLKAIEHYKATSLLGVPTMFIEILNKYKSEGRKVNSLKKGIMAGSVCPEYLMNRVANELHIKDLSICYGMTELSPITHQTLPSDSLLHKTTTVGRNIPYTITKIVDDEGNIVPRGKEGEVCSNSFGKMIGYYKDEEATKNTFDSYGFMKTGDYGIIDNDGYLTIIGRKKDTIIRGGENISPKEIEDLIGTHEKIDMVQVIAVKDIKYGDEICAWIKLKSDCKMTKEELAEYCYKNLAHYKVPRYVRFVDEFPMTITNKPKKNVMRDITNEILEKKSEDLLVNKFKK